MYYLSSLALCAAAPTSSQETDIMKEIMDRGPVQGMVSLEYDILIIEIIKVCNVLVSKYEKTQIAFHSE